MMHVGNEIGNDGAEAIANAITVNSSLTELDLSSMHSYTVCKVIESYVNRIVGTAISKVGEQALADAIATNMTLAKLEVNGMGLWVISSGSGLLLFQVSYLFTWRPNLTLQHGFEYVWPRTVAVLMNVLVRKFILNRLAHFDVSSRR